MSAKSALLSYGNSLTCSDGARVQVSKMKEEVPLPLPPKDHPPAFVLGADKDLIVDVQALKESAEVYGVQPVILKNAAHDIMLVSAHHHIKSAETLIRSIRSAAFCERAAVMLNSVPCMHGSDGHSHCKPKLTGWHAGYTVARSCGRPQPLAVNFINGS